MARLPVPGSDDGTWGEILNAYLRVSHKSDGTVKDDVVTADSVQDNSLTGSKLQDDTITHAKLDSTGTPTSGQVLGYNGTRFAWVDPSGAPNATAGTPGLIQLAGDLGGTATSPTVPDLANKQPLDADLTAIAGLSASNDDIIQRKAGAWTNRTAAQVKTDLAVTKTDVGLGNVPNTDATLRANHTGTQTAATISDFDTEVSNNTDVAANTTARHTHSNSAVLNATTASFTTADETKLDGIEALADVTDAANVDAAGAVMNSDASTAAMSFVIDEDSMATDSATKVPTQQSVKAYVDASAGGGVSDGDKGDITVSASGATWTIDNDVVTNAKSADMAQSTIKGRAAAAGTGDPTDLTATQVRTLINVEDGADVTDATNVDAAGAVMNSDASTAAMGFVVDEDNMASNSATKVPTQQSVKAYVDTSVASGISDGDKGDITVSGGGGTWTVDSGAITYAKIQDVSATSRILGRATAGAGDIEELTASSAKTVLALNNVDNTSDASKPVSTAAQTALDAKVSLTGSQTLTGGTKTWSIPKNQVALVFDRSIADDVISTDEDILQIKFGPNGTGSQRSAWFNEWGAFRVAVPSTHPSETPIKIQPGTNAGGYALAVGLSSDINDTQGGFKSNADLVAKATAVTTLAASGALTAASVAATGTVTGSNIGVKVSTGTVAPSSPSVGDVWVDTN